MSFRFALPLLLSVMVPAAFAQGDPHMSVSERDGHFVVNYYGVQRDGTVCPPSANALTISITNGQKITGLTSLRLNDETKPAIADAFKGTCRVEFDGHLRVSIHHGTNATATPQSAQAIEVVPVYEGLFSVGYQPVQCLVAPCPPGSYAIVDDTGQLLARVDAILIEGPAGSSIARGGYLDWQSDIGTIWLDDGTLAEMFRFEAGETRARISLDATN